jgi:hypothetical protein
MIRPEYLRKIEVKWRHLGFKCKDGLRSCDDWFESGSSAKEPAGQTWASELMMPFVMLPVSRMLLLSGY